MKTKILASVLVAVFAWTICGVGDARAEEFLGNMPSTGEMVAVGVGVAVVITVIIVAIVKSGSDEKAGKTEKVGQEILESAISPAAEVRHRIDPVITLQKNGVGAGVAFSF